MKKMIMFAVAMTTTLIVSSEASKEVTMARRAEQKRLSEATWEAFRQDPTNDETVKEIIRIDYNQDDSPSLIGLVHFLKKCAVKHTEDNTIPIERKIKVMEIMVRAGLVVYEKKVKSLDEYERSIAYMDISFCLIMMATLTDYDILPLLKECLQSKNENIRHIALCSYIMGKDVAAIPLLRELVNEANLSNQNRSSVYATLKFFIEDFTRQKRHDDVEKINAFIEEVRREEQARLQKQTNQTNQPTLVDGVNEETPTQNTLQE